MENKTKVENLEKIKKKKFLIIGSNFPYSIEKSYLRSFRNLKIKKVSFFSPDINIILKLFNKINNRFTRELYYFFYRKVLTKCQVVFSIFSTAFVVAFSRSLAF